MILWYLYAKYARGPLRWLLHAWFVLICGSTLTTWQHHFIDLPAGALVGRSACGRAGRHNRVLAVPRSSHEHRRQNGRLSTV